MHTRQPSLLAFLYFAVVRTHHEAFKYYTGNKFFLILFYLIASNSLFLLHLILFVFI